MPHQALSHYVKAYDVNLGSVLKGIATACRSIANEVRDGAFQGNLGAADTTNVQGETQKTLDILSNDIFVAELSKNNTIAALVSEEVDEVIWLKNEPSKGDYIIYFDPLDGSSNLEVDLSVGSIFAIMQVTDVAEAQNVLRKGTEQICAGYTVYGPSTMLVLTTGEQVDGFTVKEEENEFFLTHPKMTIPQDASEYAINASRMRYWHEPIRRYVDECNQGKDGPRGRNFNMRWVASMVAEIHRILLRGGVFMYPADTNNAEMGGKLRLMYEANPMAMIVEAAGGGASTGTERIVEVMPTTPHQRVPVILGSRNEVERINAYHES